MSSFADKSQSDTNKLLFNEQGEREKFGSNLQEQDAHRGEIQPPMYRDKWFGIAFWLHIGTLVTVAILFKVGVIEIVQDSDSDSNRRLEDTIVQDATFFASTIITPLILAPLLSITALSFMSDYAVFLIKLCLIMNIVLNVTFFILCLVTAPLTSILPGIMAAIFIWYARAVWNRIPFAAANLRTGVATIQSNLGITCLSLSAIPLTIGWVILWFYVTFMLSESKWLDSQIIEREVTDESGETHIEKNVSGLAGFCFFLLLLSLYWTFQVIYNVIHTTVAGTVGTWWFTPHQANSCCSRGLTDSLARSMTYSFGSICLGSLLVAILQALRALLNNAAQNDDRGGLMTCIAQCILSCLESLLEYFNRWAFVYVGLYGYSYVEAGKNVMGLFRYRGWTTIINDNLIHGVLSQMGFATGFVTAIVVVPLTLLFTRDINQILLAALVGLIIGAIMSSIIFGGLHSSIDTIIVLYAEAPSEFEANHPELALEMNLSWSMAYPDVFTSSSASASRNPNTMV
jgi:hypothetical protein